MQPKKLSDSLWELEGKHFSILGVPVPIRCYLHQLDNGNYLVYSPTQMNKQTFKNVNKILKKDQ